MNPDGLVFKIEFVNLVPAHPILQDLLIKMIVAHSANLIPQSLIEEFERCYTLDEYIIGAFATSFVEKKGVPFHIIPLRQVVGVDGLQDDFLKEGWHYL